MKVTVEDNGEILFDINTIKKKVVVGRGSKADLVIQNENISRMHLEISDGIDGIYVRKLSSNWVFVDGDEVGDEPILVEKGENVNLPGGYTVKAEKSKVKSVEVKRTKIEIKGGKKRKNTMDKIEIYKILIFFLIIAGGISFFGYRHANREVKVPVNTAVEQNEIRRNKIKWKIKKKQFAKIDSRVILAQKEIKTVEAKTSIDKPKCGKDSISLCQYILGDVAQFEGIVLGLEHIYLYIDIDRRKTSSFNSLAYERINEIPEESLYRLIASHYTLNPRVLSRLKKMPKYKKMFVYLVKSDGMMAVTKKVYLIDLTDFFGHTMLDYKAAIDQALNHLIQDYFDNFIGKHIHEIK